MVCPISYLPLPTFMLAALLIGTHSAADEPPVVSPFGPARSDRADAVAGYVELSDGSVYPGKIYLTRDKRLTLRDEKSKRQMEIPLRAVDRIECSIESEWMEKEWKFKELASNEKIYTGRTYPAREYLHRITLRDDRTITGPLSGIVYVQPYTYSPTQPGVYRTPVKAERFLLNKRGKGEVGEKLESLRYVKLIKLGNDALSEGREEAKQRKKKEGSGR